MSISATAMEGTGNDLRPGASTCRPLPTGRLALRIAVVVVVSGVLPGLAGSLWSQLIAWVSIAAFVTGMWRSPTATSAASWIPLASGFALFAIEDLMLALHEHVADAHALLVGSDVAGLAGAAALAVGLSALMRTDPTDRGRTALIDAGIVVTPIAVGVWIFLIGPSVSDPGITWAERLVAAAFPMGDLLCLALVVRLMAGRRRLRRHDGRAGRASGAAGGRRRNDRSASSFVVGAVLVLLAADALLLSAAPRADHLAVGWNGHWSTALSLIACCVLAAGGPLPLHRADASRRGDDTSLSTRRLVLLAAAALVTPLLLVVQWGRGADVTVPLVAAGTVVAFLLVIARMVGLVQALEFSRSQLRFEANHDLLTGLPNRQHFTRALDARLASGAPGALLFVDLDHFKLVNDTFGHQAGDDVLVEVANILRTCVRNDDLVARLAGDEYVVMIEGNDASEAMSIASRLMARLHVERWTLDGVVTVTASVGMVRWMAGTPPERAHQLVRAADQAMYEAKHAEGDRLVVTRPCPSPDQHLTST